MDGVSSIRHPLIDHNLGELFLLAQINGDLWLFALIQSLYIGFKNTVCQVCNILNGGGPLHGHLAAGRHIAVRSLFGHGQDKGLLPGFPAIGDHRGKRDGFLLRRAGHRARCRINHRRIVRGPDNGGTKFPCGIQIQVLCDLSRLLVADG